MKTLKALLPRILLLLCSQCTEAQFTTKVTEPISFNFTLQNSSKTSAGVYAADGTMIRTLWSGVQYAAGDHLADWDGTNDQGNLMTAGNYNIKVLSNNIIYNWDGVVGNSSAQKTGASVHRGFDDIQGIAVTNNFVYYAVGYSERNYSQYKTKIDDVQTRIKINPGFITSQSTFHVCTDGTFVYWAGYDGWEDADDKQFIYANRTSDDTEVNFGQYGTSVKVDLNEHVYNGIAYTNQSNAKITGIAVQQSGNFLFVSRQGLNEIKVLNKTTGQQLQTISLTAPRKIALDNQNNLWVIHGT
ncbi:MAG TPA: FlgD immunoglobulin-like domain containing protein, partial [Flavitalea sp.]|nr:FlgD immunoglobulin-like domain containing protein [Flavitalea sp.]